MPYHDIETNKFLNFEIKHETKSHRVRAPATPESKFLYSAPIRSFAGVTASRRLKPRPTCAQLSSMCHHKV
jgi:hypothetical protein